MPRSPVDQLSRGVCMCVEGLGVPRSGYGEAYKACDPRCGETRLLLIFLGGEGWYLLAALVFPALGTSGGDRSREEHNRNRPASK